MSRLPVVLVTAACVLAAPLAAQNTSSGAYLQAKGSSSLAPFVAINFPTVDGIGTGWGAGLQGTMGRGAFALLGEIGYDTFGVDEIDDGGGGGGVAFGAGGRPGALVSRTRDSFYGGTSFNTWHFAAGLRLALGPIYAGGLAGFWTEVEDFDLVPLAGIMVGKLDFGARFKGLVGDGDWFSITAAYHFGR